MNKVIHLPISEVFVGLNIREVRPDDPETQDLAASMRKYGQEVEVRVFKAQGKYYLKSGHRRLVAARLLGWDVIRAIVDEQQDEVSFIMSQFIENELRKGMSFIEKAKTFARLKDLGLSQKEIAEKFATSESDVSIALSTLRAAPKIQDAVDRGYLAPSAIEPLLSLPAEEQEELAGPAIQAKTARKITALVKAHKARKKSKQEIVQETDDSDPILALIEQELSEALLHLNVAASMPITSAQAAQRIRPRVEDLVRQASSIKVLLDGRPWKGTEDLV